MDGLVDNLIEDEAERESLRVKPTCFIILGKPGVGKSTLAKQMSESWKCILIDDTDLLNTHINNKTKEGNELLDILSDGRSIPDDVVLKLVLAKLNSPDVEHHGYVLCCLPFMSEDCAEIHEQIDQIKNLKLTPDFIINIKCPDKDLVHRLSGLKQHPETGQLYNRDQWKREEVYNKDNKGLNVEDEDEEEEEDKEQQQAEAEELQKDIVDQLVWKPENLARNVFARVNMYKDTMLRPLENYMTDHNPLYLLELDGNNTPEELLSTVMSYLGSMAIKHVSIPVLLPQPDDGDLTESIETEELLRLMSSSRAVAPGFRWRRSRWGRTCPVALKEGRVVPGKPEFCVGFQDKMYILSSQEAYQKFVNNPRPYLLPPMPSTPCKVSIIGPPRAGKSTICKLLAQHYNAEVFVMEELVKSFLVKAEQERLDKIKEETTQVAIEKVKMKMEQDDGQNSVTEDHPEVQAIVLSAVEEAKQKTTSHFDRYAEVLQERLDKIEKEDSNVDRRTRWVLDNFPKNVSQLEALQQAGFLPETIFYLTDSDGHEVLKRIYKTTQESLNKAISGRLQDEQSQNEKQVLIKKEEEIESEGKSNLKTVEETDAVAQPDHWELGYPDGPEMNEYKLQLQQFAEEWEKMKSSLTVTHCTLEIGNKSPEHLLQEMLQHMEKPFKYVPWEMTPVDLDEEAEYFEAMAEVERSEKVTSDGLIPEEDEVVITAKRLFGDTHHFCPVAFKQHNVLWPCTDKIAARYREKMIYFSSQEASDAFLQNPAQFVVQTELFKPPALRIFVLGTRGSGKTTHGEWLAQQLGLFHIDFREQLQMIVMAKTKKRVPYADDIVIPKNNSDKLEALIKEARGDDVKEDEDSSDVNNMEEEVLTDEEMAIKAYLSGEEPLNPQILDMVITQYWKQEPYRSTGFILEGFPNDPGEVPDMLHYHLFPDVVVVIEVDGSDVKNRLLPKYLEKWHAYRNNREAQLNLLRDLRKKKREENISKRRAELMAEHGLQGDKTKLSDQEGEKSDDEEEKEGADNIEDEIKAILEEEFPVEEDEKDMENEEKESEATERLQMQIEERFMKQEKNLTVTTELLTEQNIPKVTINATRKLQISQRQLLRKIQPLLINRESLFQKCLPISHNLAHKLLLSSYKLHSAFRCWDPIKQYEEEDLILPLHWPLKTTYPTLFHQYIYFFASKENRSTFMLNPLKYLRQPKPIPSLPIKIAVTGPPKSGKTTVAQMFAKNYGLARLSIGGVMRMVLNSQKHTNLAKQMKTYLSQGLVVPDELAIQCLEVALMYLVCSTRGYVLDGFPLTLKQAELMVSQSIIPMMIIELELDSVEMLKRGRADKMSPNKPHLMPDSSEILNISDSCYKEEVVQVKHLFQEQYQNWFIIDGLKSKWWIWNRIVKEVSISMKYINTYVARTQSGKAACINRMCITPKDLESRLGEFGQYCPVCLALHYHLVDCSETRALTHAAEYRGHYYKMCGENHLETFLCTPDQFVTPGCPHTLPPAHLLPRKLTEIQVKERFPQGAELKNFCPVTYMDGNQRYEALIQGKMEYAAEYRERIYIFETKEKQHKFLRTPETYWDQKTPKKFPSLSEPIPLTSLPIQSYLEQGLAVPVIKAMTAVGCLKPKHPFLNVQRSVLLYIAFYLKAFNQKSTDYTRQKYKKKLALFEENCALIPYLSSEMRGDYKPPSERSIDFVFKLNRFLALEDLKGPNGVL